MTKVKDGDTIKVHYTGTLDDGTQFDSSVGREPLEFTVGTGQIIPGFEDAVMGMGVGDSKTVLIPSDQAYGPHNTEMVLELDRGQFPPDINPQPGLQLQMRQTDNQVIVVTVTSVNGDTVTLDANHPLAGQDLTFEIELVAIA
ncbi:MAG: peptidylprolyl isomerase [Anaerolineae bacterium]